MSLKSLSESPLANLKWRAAAIVATIIIVTTLLFFRVGTFDFLPQWDDGDNVTTNHLYQPLPSDHMRELLTSTYFLAYIPVTRLVWADLADVVTGDNGLPVAQFNPKKYHLANLVIHILNALLVFLILRLFVRKDWAAGFGALFYAVHPLAVEPVAWVTGMKDVLSAFFSFLAIWIYLMFAVGYAKRPDWRLMVISTLAYVMAILSKSTSVILPLLLLLLDTLLTSRTHAKLNDSKDADDFTFRLPPVRRIAVLVVWMLAAIPVSIAARHAEIGDVGAIPNVPVFQRAFVAGDAISFYLEKVIVPISLAPDYGRTPKWLFTHSWAYCRIIIPLLIVAIAWRYRSKVIWPLASLVVLFVALIPVSGVIPFIYQMFSTVSDRYMYFAMLGPAIAFACMLELIPGRVAFAGGTAVILVLALITAKQLSYWQDTQTICTHTLAVNNKSWISYYRRGLDEESAGEDSLAIADYTKTLHFKSYMPAITRVAVYLEQQWSDKGKPANSADLLVAQNLLEKGLKETPQYTPAHEVLGDVYRELGRNSDAAEQYRETLELDPGDTYSKRLLASRYRLWDVTRP
jgi:hypothetical protein